MARGVDRLVGSLRNKEKQLSLRSATVSTVGASYVKVKYGGAAQSESDAEIPFFGDAPSVSDKVWVLQYGSIRLCLGTPSQ